METKTMRRMRVALLSVAAWGSSAAWAAGVGTTGADFLKFGVGARGLAMGSAFISVVDDANAIYWNPGALGAIGKRSLTASYGALFQDENQGFLGYINPLRDNGGTLGVGLDYLVVSNIEKRAAESEAPDSSISNQNFALSGSYGCNTAVTGLSVGGNLKYIRETLDTFSGNAVALDAGALYKTPVPELTSGLVLQNFGTKIGPDVLPMTVKGGASYRMFQQRLTLASDVDWLAQDQRVYWDLGTEFWVHPSLAVRAGYQFGHGQDQLDSALVGTSFGVGLYIERFRIDYAFLPFGNLGDTHRMSLGWMF